MRIEVLLFGPAALTARADRVPIEVTGDPTVASILDALRAQHPVLGPALAAPRLAVNQRFARPDEPVRPGDEVALIALVSGG